MYHNENPEISFVEIDEWAPRISQIRPFHLYIKHSTIGRNSSLVDEDLISNFHRGNYRLVSVDELKLYSVAAVARPRTAFRLLNQLLSTAV